METNHTTHMTANEFADAYLNAAAGQVIVYAVGDVRFSCGNEKHEKPLSELGLVRKMAWAAYERKEVCLTQKKLRGQVFPSFRDGFAFEYRATKRGDRSALLTNSK